MVVTINIPGFANITVESLNADAEAQIFDKQDWRKVKKEDPPISADSGEFRVNSNGQTLGIGFALMADRQPRHQR